MEDKEIKEVKNNEDDDVNFEDSYNELKEKYGLPEFKKFCEDFDIEKAGDKENDFLLREIRRVVNDKVSAYLHLFETLINPTSPPIFVFSILRGTSNSDKESMKEIYKTLSRTQLEIMKLDTIYNETKEAMFLKEVFEMWQNLKPTIMGLIGTFEANFEKDDSSKKSSYFD